MKRFLALFLALWMMVGLAAAEGTTPIAAYVLPYGAEAQFLWNTGAWEIPAGLEAMYELMWNANMEHDVYLTRMANGRALVSISCMPAKNLHTPEELLALWPQIALSIAREGAAVDADESCASVAQRYGHEGLQIQTTITLNDGQLPLQAEGFAFLRGSELLEIWAVAPAEGVYAPDDPAAAEWEADRDDMNAFLASMEFDDLEPLQIEAVPYADPDGRFTMAIPAGSTVLTPYSAQQELDAAREAYINAHEPGAEKLFDEYLRDLTQQQVTVIITADQQSVIEIYAQRQADFQNATVDQLAALAQPIAQSLQERFDVVMLLADNERATLAGHEHAWLGYWLRSGESDVQLDALAVVIDGDWLYEVDLFTHNGDQNARMLQMTLLTQTMQYTPLTNALGD